MENRILKFYDVPEKIESDNLTIIETLEKELNEYIIKDYKYIESVYMITKYELQDLRINHFPKILIWIDKLFRKMNFKFNV